MKLKILLLPLLLLGGAVAQTQTPNLGLWQLPYNFPHYESYVNGNMQTLDNIVPSTSCLMDGTQGANWDGINKKFVCQTITSPSSASFSAVTSGTNISASMLVGGSAVLAPTGTGIISASTAAKWVQARQLAGNSVDGSGNVPFANLFVVQGTADAGLSGAQFLGSLATGILKNTNGSGVLSVAVAGDFPTLNQNTTGTAANLSGTPALPNGTAATTQSPGDNTAKIATDAFVLANALSNPMTTLADVIYGGASGVPTRLAGPMATNGVPQVLTEIPSGGVAVAPAWSPTGVGTNAQTGTTYTIAATDRSSYVTLSNASSIAVTLPQAGTTGFASNFVFRACDIGAGTATITPTTSTISYTTGAAYTAGASTLVLRTGQCASIYSDNSNYFANLTAPAATPLTTGTSVTLIAPRQYFVCTSTCTVTPPVPAAGYEFCVMNTDNVATVITMAALGSSARYENTARTAYGTAGTGTFISGGAVGDKVCLVGLDSTHYLTVSFNGTWTAN